MFTILKKRLNYIKLPNIIPNLILVGFVFWLNYVIFRFEDYAVFRDYIIVKNQDFSFNNSNPISIISDYLQNNLLSSFSLKDISSIYYILLFSIGFFISYFSLIKIYRFFKIENSTKVHKKELLENKLQSSSLNDNTNYLTDFISSKSELALNKITSIDKDEVHNLSKLETVSLIFLTILFCYNPFILERFLMGQEKIFWGYFLVLPYIYNLFKYLKFSNTKQADNRNYTWNKIRLVFISLMVSLSNIHMMVILTGLTLAMSLVFSIKKFKVLYFSVFNLILIGVSLLLNFKIFSDNTSNFYFNNIAQNPTQTDQIYAAFSAQVNPDQNLIQRVLIGAGSWNTPTFVEVLGIKNSLGVLADFSLYFNQNWGVLFLVFLVLSTFLGLCLIYQIPRFKNTIFPLFFLVSASSIFSFGYSLEFLKPINRLILSIPGSYVFREPGKIYIIVYIVAIFLIVVTLSKFSLLKNSRKLLWYTYISILGILSISSMLPFFKLNSNLNYIKIPSIIEYTLSNCQNRTLAVLPSTTYIVPSYSKVFIANPFLVAKNNECNIIKSNKIELQGRDGNLIDLDISGENEKFDQVMTQYVDNLPKINQGEIIVDASNQTTNTLALTSNLKKINIELLFVDFSSIDYKLYLKNDLDLNAELLKEDGNFALYQL